MIANSILCNGVSRFLQTVYMKDLVVSGDTTFDTITATGNITTNAAFYSSISGLYVNNKQAIFASTASDTWLRINANKAFTSGTYYGSSVVRTDGELQVGSSGAYLKSNSSNTTIANLVAPVASIASITGTKGIYDNFQVLDELRAKRYSLESIQSLGGSFLIAPVLYFSTNCTVQITAISGTTVTAAIIDSSTINTDTVGGVQWAQYSKVKISGKLGNVVLGTCTGTLTAKMNTTAGRINLTFTFDDASSLSVKTYAASEISDLAVMIYEKGVNSTTSYPVGIFMTGYGTNNASYIDIYNAETSRTKPRVRLGKLDELDSTIKVGGITPSGFGLYATNAFLEGAIHATSGVMGGWTLSDDKIYHTANAPGSTSTVLSPGGVNSTLSIGGSPANTQNAWAFTVKNKFGITTAGKLYCSDADIAGKVAATSGEIGGFEITSSAIKTKDVAVTSNADNSVSLSSSDFTRTVAGASRTNLRFAIGKNFAVTNSGALYASSGILGKWTINTMGLYYSSVTVGSSSIVFVPEGTVSSSTAIGGSSGNKQWVFTVKDYFGIDTSGNMFSKGGKVGGFEIGPSYLVNGTWGNSGSVMMSTGTSGAKAIGGSASTVNGWAFTAGNAFGVTKTGSLYCSDAHVNGEVTATSGEIGGWNVINNTIYTNTTDSSGIVTTVALQNSVLDVSTTNCIASANKDSITLTTLEDGAISTQTIVLPVSGTGTYTIELSISRPYYVSGSFVCYYYYGGSIGTSSVSIPSVSGSSGTIISNHTINLPSNIDLTQLTVKSNFSNCLKDDQVIMTFVIKRGSETVLIGWDYVQGTKLPSNIIIGVNKTDSSGTYENPFYLTHSGKIYCENIEAVGGEIAGWKISPSKIYKSVTSSNDETWITGLQSGGSPTNAAFYAGWDGTGNITENSNFWVRNNGYLYSNSGLIAGWKINGSRIECTNTNGYAGLQSANDATSAAFYAGWTGSGNITENSNFWVRHNGTLYAKSGKIGNWDITTSGWFKSTKNSDYIEMSNEWINLYDATDKITTSLNYSGLYIYNNGATKTMQATYAGVALVDGSNLTKMFANSIQTNGYIDFTNSTYGGRLITTSAGNFGLQDKSDSSWVIYCDTANIVHIPLRVVTQNFDGTNRTPIGSTSGSNSEVSHMQSTSGGLNITAKWTSSSLSARSLSISSSDIRLKENIKKTDISGLDLINKIDMYSFDWKETHKHQNLGFIADYLEEIDPHLSVGDGGKNEDGIPVYKSVDTFYLQGYEVRAIQELSKENEELKKRISRLEEIINGR